MDGAATNANTFKATPQAIKDSASEKTSMDSATTYANKVRATALTS